MRDFSKINPSLWASKRFTKLDDIGKLFYLYCLSSPQSNSCGCYRLPIGYAMEDLGWNQEQVIYGIDTVSDTNLIQYNQHESVIYIDRWYDYNAPSNPKHSMKVINELSCVPRCALRDKNARELSAVIQRTKWDSKDSVLAKIHDLFDTVSRLGDTETKTETETETLTPLIPLEKGEYEKEKGNDRDRLQPRTRRNQKPSYTDLLADAASQACEKVSLEKNRKRDAAGVEDGNAEFKRIAEEPD